MKNSPTRRSVTMPPVLRVLILLIAYAQAGYGLLLAVLRRVLSPRPVRSAPIEPAVTLVIAAYNEQSVIAAKVANALALDYPRDRLQVVVASDGSSDETARLAREAGADLVLELPRGGKIRAQDAAVRAATGEIVAFGDANALWERDALRELVTAFADPEVGYACGRVTFVNESGTNQEGVYWRYEMWLRGMESGLDSITAGNGAIYATRREAYVEVDPVMGHDLMFPFSLVKNGWRAVDVPTARASEKMVPSIEGEFARKRRMMGHGWPIVLRGGLLDPRGYPPRYLLFIASHRVLRYATPFLHVAALALTIARWREHKLLLAAQLGLLAGAAAGGRVRARPLLLARYYVATTASLGISLLDYLRHGTEAGWDTPEGTR
ncbi:MAG: glycosyl transferase family 2 [Solirubrobacterales bacterium]|nr:glycosyl transferase family 2 [Solirubrobacterales bacterium]